MADTLNISVANEDHYDVVYWLFEELLQELGPTNFQAQIRKRLPQDIRDALTSSNVRIFIGELHDEAIAVARADVLSGNPIFRLREQTLCGYVDQMFVRRAFRKRGFGRLMLHHCEEWFAEQGLDHALLHAAPNAVRFYSRAGYQPNREYFKRLR